MPYFNRHCLEYVSDAISFLLYQILKTLILLTIFCYIISLESIQFVYLAKIQVDIAILSSFTENSYDIQTDTNYRTPRTNEFDSISFKNSKFKEECTLSYWVIIGCFLARKGDLFHNRDRHCLYGERYKLSNE